ncbi:MAG: 30S ribosomal protein S8 [Chlamydiales bacterium]
MVNDPIADLLTRIRNASMGKHFYLDIHCSKLLESIVKILKDNGFIAYYLVKEENKRKTMRIFLKYTDERERVIHGLKRVSKSSLRKYVKAKSIPTVLGRMGISIISTSKGLMDDQTARKQNLGGELICQVW